MRNKTLLIIFFLVFINFFAFKEVFRINKPHFLEIYFFDVGQGDSAFIKTPSNHRILIDGGPNSFLLKKLSEIISPYDKNIDLIILTHPHSDHLRGLIDVIQSYNIKNIIWTGAKENTSDFERWEEVIKKVENIFIAQRGIRAILGDTKIDILHPFDNLEEEYFKDLNETSIIAKVVYIDNKLIFTGDSYKKNENELVYINNLCKKDDSEEKTIKESFLCEFINLDSDILQVGHHGSKTSTSIEFLDAVSPNLAIISSGINNKYGHPHQETLELLDSFDIKILRTEKLGDIKLIGNGKEFKIIN